MFSLLHWPGQQQNLGGFILLLTSAGEGEREKNVSLPPFIVDLALLVCAHLVLTSCCAFVFPSKDKNLSLRMWITFSIHQWLRCLRASTLASTKCVEERSSSSSSPTSCRPWSLATLTMTGKNSKRYFHNDLFKRIWSLI